MDQVSLFGYDWLEDAWKYIQEDKADQYMFWFNLMPLARTPMDKKAGSSMNRYAKSIERYIKKIAPWVKDRGRVDRLRGRAKPGEMVVVLGAGESADNELFRGLKVIKE